MAAASDSRITGFSGHGIRSDRCSCGTHVNRNGTGLPQEQTALPEPEHQMIFREKIEDTGKDERQTEILEKKIAGKDDGKGDTGKEDTGKDDGKGDTGKDDTGKDDGKEDEAFTGLKEIDGIWWHLTEGDVDDRLYRSGREHIRLVVCRKRTGKL